MSIESVQGLLAELSAAECTIEATSRGTLKVRPSLPEHLRERVAAAKPELLVYLQHVAWLGQGQVDVRIEYDEDGSPVGVWIVPDEFPATTFYGEPALRRREIATLLDEGPGALRRPLVVLRAFPGARVCGAGGSAEAGR